VSVWHPAVLEYWREGEHILLEAKSAQRGAPIISNAVIELNAELVAGA
jgi:hypothetical protein